MNELKKALAMRGMKQNELAVILDMPSQNINAYAQGARMLGPKLLPQVADILQVSAAYLRGDAQRLAVRDFVTGNVDACKIVTSSQLGNYGIFYIVEHDAAGLIAVILSDGVQFTTSDRQNRQPMAPEEIKEYDWVDASGRDAVMLDGYPRMIW